MTIQVPALPSRSRRWLQRSLLGLGVATLAIAAGGATYQSISTAPDQQRFPAPGELVSVGNHRLHIHEMGSHHTGATIVLESGLGVPSVAWTWVQPEVAKFARVVSYDRAGLGWSEDDHNLVDAHQTAAQLHTLLQEANIPEPYILVGHSMGGMYIRQFAEQYPDQVAGLVMVDVSHPDQLTRLPQSVVDMQLNGFKLFQASPWLARFGILRATNLHGRMMKMNAGTLPPAAQAAAASLYTSVKHALTMSDETRQWDTVSNQVRATGDLGDRPLIVLSANPTLPQEEAAWLTEWQSLHAELATLSTQGEHRLVDGADHVSLLLNPDHAQIVTGAIREVITQVQP